MGADRGIHVDTSLPSGSSSKSSSGEDSEALEPLTTAHLLHAVAVREKCNLLILGKQSIDGDNAQTGPMVAGLLGWAQATQACGIKVGEDGVVEVEREVDGGTEVVRGRLPMVVTADLRLNVPRYASLGGIMKAKRKGVERVGLGEFGVGRGGRLRTLRVVGEFFCFFFWLGAFELFGGWWFCCVCACLSREFWKVWIEKVKLTLRNSIEPSPRQGGQKVENVDGMISKLKELGAI